MDRNHVTPRRRIAHVQAIPLGTGFLTPPLAGVRSRDRIGRPLLRCRPRSVGRDADRIPRSPSPPSTSATGARTPLPASSPTPWRTIMSDRRAGTLAPAWRPPRRAGLPVIHLYGPIDLGGGLRTIVLRGSAVEPRQELARVGEAGEDDAGSAAPARNRTRRPMAWQKAGAGVRGGATPANRRWKHPRCETPSQAVYGSGPLVGRHGCASERGEPTLCIEDRSGAAMGGGRIAGPITGRTEGRWSCSRAPSSAC